jgi:hypothetical protein
MTFDGGKKTLAFYIDGALQGTATDTDIGTLSGGSGFAVGIGNIPEGGAFAWDGTNNFLALVRIMQSGALGNETDFLRMYRDELPLYSVNAKCLLQSGSTDIVLDAAVDPLTSKCIVTQTDSQEIFNGLAIETERTVATGGSTFEHGLLFGDALAEINNANLFASTPVTDQRQVNEMVRSLSADPPTGPDLSKAKAWISFDGTGTINILNSYNVESITDKGTGFYEVQFAIPFKEPGAAGGSKPKFVAVGMTENEDIYLFDYGRDFIQVKTEDNGSIADTNIVMLVFFGELDNE